MKRPLTRSAEDYSPSTQICFPYRGAFAWHVAGQDIVGDPNQICTAGRDIRGLATASGRLR
jgi:hypothetical protein